MARWDPPPPSRATRTHHRAVVSRSVLPRRSSLSSQVLFDEPLLNLTATWERYARTPEAVAARGNFLVMAEINQGWDVQQV